MSKQSFAYSQIQEEIEDINIETIIKIEEL